MRLPLIILIACLAGASTAAAANDAVVTGAPGGDGDDDGGDGGDDDDGDDGDVSTGALSSDSAMASAEERLDNGDPDGALQLLSPPPRDLPLRGFIQHQRLLATARAFTGDTDGAVAAFVEILLSEPSFTMPYTASPKVTVAFEEARTQRRQRLPLTLDLRAPAVARLGEPIVVDVTRRSDPQDQIRHLRLEVVNETANTRDVYRIAAPALGQSAPLTLPAIVDDATIARDEEGRPGVLLRVRVVGLDARGCERVVGDPVPLPVGFDAPAPWWQSPFLWAGVAAVGVAITGGLVAGVVVASLPPDDLDVDVVVRR